MNIHSIVESILGPVEWIKDGSQGIIECPGKSLHSNPTSKGQCVVFAEDETRPTTIFCFHQSCKGILDQLNFSLRSEIGKAKFNSKPFAPAIHDHEKDLETQLKRQWIGRKKDELKKRARITLQTVLSDPFYDWSKTDCKKDSPVDCSKIENHPWIELVEAIFEQDDVVWMGGKYDSKPSHFKTSSEWCRQFLNRNNEPFRKLPQSYQLISPWAFFDGAESRTKSNARELKALVIESDELGLKSFRLFKWLKGFLRLRAVVSSGGKSYHAWFDVPNGRVLSELRFLANDLQIDPSVIGGLVSRLPGQIRLETGRIQELMFLDPAKPNIVSNLKGGLA